MDLRARRTKKCIENAFLELRKKKPIEKISVKEIADVAMINKATFYNHFESVFDLSDKMENEAIENVIKNIPPEEWSTGIATKKLATAMNEESSNFNVLFSDTRQGVLVSKLEEKLKEAICVLNPEYKKSLEKDILLTTLIYGCFYAFKKCKDDDYEKAIDTIVEINEYLIKGFSKK